MHIKALKTLIRIAEVESFATAAHQLGITLSALSMQMKTLEQELGANLFDRSYRPPRLTPIGRRVAEQSKTIVAAEAELLEVCHPDSPLSGIFRIGFVATASVRLLPGFLKHARNLVPHVSFELETGLSEVLEEKVATGQLDAAVLTASDEAATGLQYDTLRTEELHFAIPVTHKEVPLKELPLQLPFLQFNPRSGIGKVIAGHIARLGGKRGTTIRLDSVEAIMECVNEGIGFTMLAVPDIERYARSELHCVAPGGKNLTRKLVLATNKGNMSDTARQKLVHLFEDE